MLKMPDCTRSIHCHTFTKHHQLQKLCVWFAIKATTFSLGFMSYSKNAREKDKLSHLIALKKLSSEDLNTLILKSLLWRPTVEHCIDSAEFHEANLYLTHSQIEKQSYRETTVNANHLKGNITIHFGATAGVILIRWKGKRKVRNE